MLDIASHPICPESILNKITQLSSGHIVVFCCGLYQNCTEPQPGDPLILIHRVIVIEKSHLDVLSDLQQAFYDQRRKYK